jgi:prepilin-type N-terminal cleavage/methylation domain-containing protein
LKKGFTLIELMVVIIVIAILAVIAIIQYNLAIERTRAAEAKDVLGYMRKTCSSIYSRDHSVIKCTPEALGIGIEQGMIPPECYRSHYFNYSAEESSSFENVMIFTATRCMKYGRFPNVEQFGAITLTVDYANGTDSLSSVGVY